MDVFVARQPIFDVGSRVVGYELLHRVSRANRYAGTDPLVATSQLLAETVLSGQWHRLTAGRPAWVNFPRSMIIEGPIPLVPPERMVVELLEDIAADDAVVAACADLAGRGYTLAADDVTDPDDDNPLLDLVHVIKVDVRATGAAQRAALARRFGGRARMLAEKVETRAEHAEAVELGYELLQGYFLNEPAVVAQRTIGQSRLGVLSALRAVSRVPMDFGEVESAIKREVALTDKLLRYLNSAAFGFRVRMASIRDALVVLGEVQIRRWVAVFAVATVAGDQPAELMVSTLIRARMCEQVATGAAVRTAPLECFLTGLYSQMHLLLGMDLASTMDEAPVPEPVRRALLERDGPLWATLDLVSAWEDGDWDRVNDRAVELGVALDDLPAYYADAVAFADDVRGVDRVHEPVG